MVSIRVTRYPLEPKRPWMGRLPKWQWLMKWTHEEGEVEFEVEVEGMFYKGEPMSFDSPGEPGYVEFEAAYVDGRPFSLTPEEMARAEEAILDDIRSETSNRYRRRWAI